jgi:hypothetical protein
MRDLASLYMAVTGLSQSSEYQTSPAKSASFLLTKGNLSMYKDSSLCIDMSRQGGRDRHSGPRRPEPSDGRTLG